MPRATDRPFPTIDVHRPPVEPWPAVLHVGVDREPVAAYTYDDGTAVYDDAEGDYVYDDTDPEATDRIDLWCRLHGMTINVGAPDEEGNFAAGYVEATFDNRDGGLSQYSAAGQLTDWVPGARFDVWAELDGDGWWLFSGRVTAWRERSDGTVEAEAYDAFADLNQYRRRWTPGAHGDLPADRMAAIALFAGYTGPARYDTGTVTLHSVETDRTPLEELQQTALSDGGALAVDADGTLTYRDRSWPYGRPDQTTVPMFSDNYCAAPHIVWDAATTTDDATMVNIAELANVATPQLTATAVDVVSADRYGPRTLPARRYEDLWIEQSDGDALAAYLVTRRADHYLRLEQFVLYLHDPNQNLWRAGIDLRLGDLVTWVHEQQTTTGPATVIITAAVQTIVHEITPEAWVTTVATTRTVGHRTPGQYDYTTYTYDDPDPANIYVL